MSSNLVEGLVVSSILEKTGGTFDPGRESGGGYRRGLRA